MARDYNLESSWRIDDETLQNAKESEPLVGGLGTLWNSAVDTISGIWNDWTGQTSQMREFEQQEYLQDKMNAYNTPVAQMERMRAAGINPNTAAAAIAGSGSESAQAPQVSTNTQGISAGVNAAANLASSLGAGFESTAKGLGDLFKLQPEIENIASDTKKKLASAGVDEATIRGLDIDNMYKDDEWKKKLRILDLTADNLDQEWKKMQSEYDLNYALLDKAVKDLEVSDSVINLNNANKDYLIALKQKTDYEKEWMKIRFDFWKQRGFDILANSRDLAIVQMIENGKIAEVKNIFSILRENDKLSAFAVKNAEQQAIKDNIYDITYEQNKADLDMDWVTPPKTIVEAIFKTFDNAKSKIDKLMHPGGKDENTLRKSYYQISNIRNQKKEMLDMLEYDLAENYPHGTNKVDIEKIHLQIEQLRKELDELPKSYRDYVRKVRNQ